MTLAAESDPSQFLGAAGELLVSGNAAGLDNSETLGLLAFATRSGEVDPAKTQLRNVFKKLSADPKVRDQIKASGVSVEGDPLDILNRLKAANVSSEQLIQLFGTENSDVVQAFIAESDVANDFVEQTRSAVAGPDKANAFLQDLVNKSPRHAKALQIAQQKQRLEELQRGDADKAQDLEIARNELEIQLEKAVKDGTINASAKKARLELFDDIAGQDSLALVRGAAARGEIELTPAQAKSVEGFSEYERYGFFQNLPKEGFTYKQSLAAAANEVESGTYASDILSGGNQSTRVELSDSVQDALREGPALPSGGSKTVNNYYNGTFINNSGNPLEDDLDGRYRE